MFFEILILTFQKLKLMIQNDVLVMITIYTNFLGAISSTQISNFLLMGTLWNFFLWEPFRGRLVSVFELIKKIFYENVFFLTKCHYPYLLLLKIIQKWKITPAYCTVNKMLLENIKVKMGLNNVLLENIRK